MVWEWIIFGILIGVLKLVWEVRKYSRLRESVDSIEQKIQGLLDFDAADSYISPAPGRCPDHPDKKHGTAC